MNIRGWLEGNESDIDLVRGHVEEEAPDNWHNFGWRFPHPQLTGHWYAFFGLHVGVVEIEWFLGQLRRFATLSAPGTTPSLRGLFLISAPGEEMTQVQVTNGRAVVAPAAPTVTHLDG